jgi:hypothetical protein
MRAAYPTRPPFRVLDVHVSPVVPGAAQASEAPIESDVG